MANLTILRSYALKNPETLPSSILFNHTTKTLTIYDAFPKSIFHFLILPRVIDPFQASDLKSLHSLLQGDKERAKQLILTLREDAEKLKNEIKDEMSSRYGFTWDIWTGFHGAPSMEHVHLHVLSADLCSERLKNKKHYNSFHPKLGFFLHIDDVLSWFDAEPSFYNDRALLKANTYEPILKEGLSCFRCGASMKNIPTLKEHLQKEWNKLEKQEKQRQEHKRKLKESETTAEGNSAETQNKKLKLQTESEKEFA